MAKRIQIPNPFDATGRQKLSISGENAKFLAEVVRQKVQQWKLGLLPEAEVRKIFERVTKGPLQVKEAWDLYIDTLTGDWERQARSTWGTHFAEFESVAAVECTEARMQAWARGRSAALKDNGEPYAKASLDNAWHLFRAALKRQIPDRLDALPWGRWKPIWETTREHREREACRSVEEVMRLIRAAEEIDRKRAARTGYADLAYRLLIGWLCCLRQGEIGGLGWDDVKGLDGGCPPTIQIRHQVKDGWRRKKPQWTRPIYPPKWRERKGKVDPPILLHRSAIRVLLAQREQLVRQGWYRCDGPVFPCQAHQHCGDWRSHADAIHPDREMRVVVALAGLPGDVRDWVPHSVRITGAAMEYALSGRDAKATMPRTRHLTRTVLEDAYARVMSRGLVASALPDVEVPAPLGSFRVELLDPERAAEERLAALPAHEEPADPWGLGPPRRVVDVAELSQEDFRVLEAARKERQRQRRTAQKSRYMGRDVASMASVWAEWTAAGRPSDEWIPPALAAACKKAYDRGYNQRLRKYRPKDAGQDWRPTDEQRADCQRSGIRARRGTEAAWKKHRRKCLAQEAPAAGAAAAE